MPTPFNAAVRAEIRAEVARQALTQQQVADRLGERQWWVSRRLTGENPIEVLDLVRIASALGVPIEQFIPDHSQATEEELARVAAWRGIPVTDLIEIRPVVSA
jgi:transcriptional regulator with XRE-family HTH domain